MCDGFYDLESSVWIYSRAIAPRAGMAKPGAVPLGPGTSAGGVALVRALAHRYRPGTLSTHLSRVDHQHSACRLRPRPLRRVAASLRSRASFHGEDSVSA